MNTRQQRNHKSPETLVTELLLSNKDPPGFFIDLFPRKGRGVRTCSSRKKDDFLLFYKGECIPGEEGEKREKVGETGFRFFVTYKGKRYCIDASKESDGAHLGRLINHGQKGERNVKVKLLWINEKPTIVFFAARDIQEKEELLYDYGLTHYPWDDNCK